MAIDAVFLKKKKLMIVVITVYKTNKQLIIKYKHVYLPDQFDSNNSGL